MPQVTLKQRVIIVALIGLGFVGLMGAHELAATAPPLGAPHAIGPLVLFALGIFCFVAAGLMARKLMR